MEPAGFGIARFAAAARRDVLEAMAMLPDAPLARARSGIPLIVVQDPDLARQVLISDSDSYRKPGLVRRPIAAALGENLFTAEGDRWLQRRRPVAPVFAAPNMNGLASMMAATISDRTDRWEAGTWDMQEELAELALSVACRALFGIDGDGELGRTVRREFQTLLRWLGSRLSNPVAPPPAIPTSSNRAMSAARRRLHRVVAEVVRERRAAAGEGDDILGRLVQAHSGRPGPTDDVDIVEECVGFLFAGHETTAATMTWAMYELATNPEVQRGVAAEGRAIDLDSDTLHDDAETLVDTAAVVEETLRLHPAGISIARVAGRRTRLGGVRVRKGTMIIVAVQRMHRSPRLWDRPHEFDPSRLVDPLAPSRHDPFLPFGLGPRRCLGARFARTEMRLALALICSRWDVSYDLPAAPVAEVSPSLRVKGSLPLTIRPRSTTSPPP